MSEGRFAGKGKGKQKGFLPKKVCQFTLDTGSCKHGANCGFAHTLDELNLDADQDEVDKAQALGDPETKREFDEAFPESKAKSAFSGDWTCPGCGDLQFARNAVCRMCKTPGPIVAPVGMEEDVAEEEGLTGLSSVQGPRRFLDNICPTKLCFHWLIHPTACIKSDSCTYAHGLAEIGLEGQNASQAAIAVVAAATDIIGRPGLPTRTSVSSTNSRDPPHRAGPSAAPHRVDPPHRAGPSAAPHRAAPYTQAPNLQQQQQRAGKGSSSSSSAGKSSVNYPSSSPPSSAKGKGGGGGGVDGDWLCPDCGMSNFAKRDACFKCGLIRAGGGKGGPSGSAPSYGKAKGGSGQRGAAALPSHAPSPRDSDGGKGGFNLPQGRFDIAAGGFMPTKLCQNWVQDRDSCPRGQTCSFAHGVVELQPKFIPTCGITRFHHTGFCPRVMCKNYPLGTCQKGLLCTFAHGPEELRANGGAH